MATGYPPLTSWGITGMTTTEPYAWYCWRCYTYHTGQCPYELATTHGLPVVNTLRPYRCPVCDGRAKVQFDPENPYVAVSAGAVLWDCKPCQGTGVLWK